MSFACFYCVSQFTAKSHGLMKVYVYSITHGVLYILVKSVLYIKLGWFYLYICPFVMLHTKNAYSSIIIDSRMMVCISDKRTSRPL